MLTRSMTERFTGREARGCCCGGPHGTIASLDRSAAALTLRSPMSQTDVDGAPIVLLISKLAWHTQNLVPTARQLDGGGAAQTGDALTGERCHGDGALGEAALPRLRRRYLRATRKPKFTWTSAIFLLAARAGCRPCGGGFGRIETLSRTTCSAGRGDRVARKRAPSPI